MVNIYVAGSSERVRSLALGVWSDSPGYRVSPVSGGPIIEGATADREAVLHFLGELHMDSGRMPLFVETTTTGVAVYPSGQWPVLLVN